ncbi:MAG: phage terminase large subunit [Eubacteriales bacterium]|nr:phage terminase large subunit [Eubacteriales bacterium]
MEFLLKGYPNPRQRDFFASHARHTAYGGARGGGKSWAMRRKLVLLALHYEGLQLLLLRRTLPELTENHVRPLQTELSGFVNYNQTQRVFTFPNGSRIKLGYCDNEQDVFQYQGQEYDVIGLEEATQFTESQMQFISTCNRSVRTDFSPRMYYTCNPGGVGHGWVKRLFIDRRYRASEQSGDYVFIPARVTDNPILMRDASYKITLENLPEPLRRAYLEGDWDVLAGQYFGEFSRERHVAQPFDIPKSWRRFRAMDWGFRDPCAVLWFAVAPGGRVYVYREYYERNVLSSETAKRIRLLTGEEAIAYTAASPDAWQCRGMNASGDLSGMSIAEVFAHGGVPLIRADNARIAGWQRIREYLAAADDGEPKLVIFRNCENLIRTLPMLAFDERFTEDVSGDCEDHAPEALRYGLMSRPVSAGERKRPKARAYDPFAAGEPRADGFTGL